MISGQPLAIKRDWSGRLSPLFSHYQASMDSLLVILQSLWAWFLVTLFPLPPLQPQIWPKAAIPYPLVRVYTLGRHYSSLRAAPHAPISRLVFIRSGNTFLHARTDFAYQGDYQLQQAYWLPGLGPAYIREIHGEDDEHLVHRQVLYLIVAGHWARMPFKKYWRKVFYAELPLLLGGSDIPEMPWHNPRLLGVANPV